MRICWRVGLRTKCWGDLRIWILNIQLEMSVRAQASQWGEAHIHTCLTKFWMPVLYWHSVPNSGRRVNITRFCIKQIHFIKCVRWSHRDTRQDNNVAPQRCSWRLAKTPKSAFISELARIRYKYTNTQNLLHGGDWQSRCRHSFWHQIMARARHDALSANYSILFDDNRIEHFLHYNGTNQ